MIPHYIPLPHQFLQPWMKLSKCIIKTPVRLDIFAPLAGFQRDWSDMSDPLPEHIRVSEGISLRLGQPILAGFHPPSSISWPADPPARAPPDSRPNPAAFHPAAAVFFDRLPALAPRPVYRLSRRLPSDSDQFSACLCRFRTFRTSFGSSIDRSKRGMKNTLCCRVGETK
jgi:hypothetical protein